MADSAAINSPDYWNQRFALDWTARGGAEQTAFFAGLAIAMLPDWFWADAIANKLSLVDVGCALGEALPGFRTRLPQSKLTGVDVSKVAIRMARERLPDFTFRAVKPDWSDAPRGDIMFCSNTLEHLKDWKKRLAQLSEMSEKYVLMLVPFQEQELIDEHVVRFDFTSFPASLPDGRRLLYIRILDASQAQNTYWHGHQALALYGPKANDKARADASNDPYTGADFRGRSVAQIKAVLLALQAAYPGKESVSLADAQQAAIDRVNAEWAQKLDASVSEMNAKHAELRDYYESVIKERDAKLDGAVTDLVAKHGEQKAYYERLLSERDAKLEQSVADLVSKHGEQKAYYERLLSERDAKLEQSVADLVGKYGEQKAHYERLLSERDAKLEQSVADLVGKHSELKAHYERILTERDARIAQLSEIQAWRQRAHELEDALRQSLTQQLKRSEEQAAALAEQALQARVEAAQIKAEASHAARVAEQAAALEHEKLRAAAAERARELDVLRTHAAQDVAAAERKAQAVSEALTRARAEADQRTTSLEQRRAALEAQVAQMQAALDAAEAEAERARADAVQAASEVAAACAEKTAALAEAARLVEEAERAVAEAEELRARQPISGVSNEAEVASPALLAEMEAARATIAERERDVETLKADVKRATADHAALKAAIRAAVDERDQARAGQAGVSTARVEALEAELAQAKVDAQAGQDAAAAARQELQALQAQQVSAMRELVDALDPALDALRRAWQGDYARLSSRGALLEQSNEELRTQVMRILSSKSLKIGTSVRRVYWTLLGQPGAPNETAPAEIAAASDPGSEFLRVWERAKRSADGARRTASGASVSPAPAAPSPPPAPPVPPPPAFVAPVAPSPRISGGRVIALQAASLGNGGLERVVFDLAVGLQARGETVLAVCVNAGGAFADELRQRGIEVHEINRDVPAFERLLRDKGVTDLFTHHSYFGYERAASLGLRLYDVVHNYYFWHRGNGAMIRRISELCTGIVYVSAAVRAFHERVFGVPTAKGVVINNPAHLDGLIVPEKVQLQRLREKSTETIFLNVAQAFPAKAQPAMITAFARAWRKNRSMKLQIAGAQVREDAGRAVRDRIDAEAIGNAVELLGHCDRRKMSRLYAEAHAFVLPSLYEGYSVSAIEAATYSLPLVLTNVGGAEDLVSRSGCGILLPPATDDLAKFDPPAIERLGLENENAATPALEKAFLTIAEERAAWIQRGLAAHYNILTLDDVIDAYLAVMPASARAST